MDDFRRGVGHHAPQCLLLADDIAKIEGSHADLETQLVILKNGHEGQCAR